MNSLDESFEKAKEEEKEKLTAHIPMLDFLNSKDSLSSLIERQKERELKKKEQESYTRLISTSCI